MTVPGPVTVADFGAAAREIMDTATAAFFNGGAGDEITLWANVTAYESYRLRPFAGLERDVDLSTTVLGQPVAMPIGVAPAARQGLLDPEAEVATARAASALGVPVCISSASSRPLGEVAAAAGEWWYQSYAGFGPGPEVARDLGCGALVLTLDAAVPGHRDRELRAARAAPEHSAFRGGSGYASGEVDFGIRSARAVTWTEVERAVATSGLPVVAKGVMSAEDALRCVESGVSAVWVSNHGGRQLDRAPATVEVLAGIVEAVDGRAEVYLDGGVRRGADVVIGLALGARAVFVGRPVLWGLAFAGERGVRDVLAQLRREVANVMTLVAAPTPDSLGRRHLWQSRGPVARR